MSQPVGRRSFIQTGLATGAAFALPGAERVAEAAEERQLVIVQAKEVGKVSEEELGDFAHNNMKLAVENLGGMQRFVKKGEVVWVKPNIGWNRTPEQAANTNPYIVKALIEMAYDAGAKKVKVSDNTCNEARKSYDKSGIQAIATEAGAEVLFHDKRKYKDTPINGKTFKSWTLYQDILKADTILNCPIAKDHTIANLTLSIKNLMGIMGGKRNETHAKLGPFLADLAAFLQPKLKLTVIDACRVLIANGPTGGRLDDVERRDTIIAGTDFVAADAYATTLFDRPLEKIIGIKEAEELGLGTTDYKKLCSEPILV